MYRDEAKNFYYDVTISSPDGKKTTRLTDTLMKQCVKAEIVEAIASEEQGGASSLSLSFVEADFLPDNRNKTPIDGVNGRGYTTNRTGALIDIRFDSEKGFTYVTPEEIQSGLTKSSRSSSGKSEPVKFLFSNNNIVEITWGHLEPRTSRKRKFRIGVVNYATGASGNTLTLECYTIEKDMARLKLDEGKVFVDQQGQAQSLKQSLFQIATIFGARLDFDEEFVKASDMDNYNPPSNYVLDRTERGGDTKVATSDNPLYLVRNQTIDGWIRELAYCYNSTYEVYDDPLTGEPVIKFTAKKLRFNTIVQTLNYRDPNGIMLDFQFNTIAGEQSKEAAVSAVDEDGKAESLYLEPQLSDKRDSDKEPTTFDPVPLVYNRKAREELSRGLVGKSETAPSTTRSTVQSAAAIENYQKSFMGFITVKAIGHPDLRPDVMKVEGVGARASTTYRFFQVQHSLGASGYICTMQGKTQEQVEQGVSSIDQAKENEIYLRTRLEDTRENNDL